MRGKIRQGQSGAEQGRVVGLRTATPAPSPAPRWRTPSDAAWRSPSPRPALEGSGNRLRSAQHSWVQGSGGVLGVGRAGAGGRTGEGEEVEDGDIGLAALPELGDDLRLPTRAPREAAASRGRSGGVRTTRSVRAMSPSSSSCHIPMATTSFVHEKIENSVASVAASPPGIRPHVAIPASFPWRQTATWQASTAPLSTSCWARA